MCFLILGRTVYCTETRIYLYGFLDHIQGHVVLLLTIEKKVKSMLPVFQESENLEKENAALRKEVKQLSEEVKYLSSVLSSHEPLCTGLTPQTTDILYSPHHGSYHQHIPVPHYQH